MAFLLPIAGLALGALGRLIKQRRDARAVGGITGSATGIPTSITSTANASETSASTAASTVASAATTPPPGHIAQREFEPGQGPNTEGSGGAFNQGSPDATIGTGEAGGGTQLSSGSTNKRDRGNQNDGKPGGLSAAQQGEAAVAAAKKKNKDQQATLSGAATTQ